MYDPAAHREFVTGFRKRKQERRTKAAKDIEAADKQARRDDRKHRRDVLRRTADRARGLYTASSDDEDDEDGVSGDAQKRPRGKGGADGKGVRISRVYEGANDASVTTTVTPIATFADSNFSLRMPKRRALKAFSKGNKEEPDNKPKSGGDGSADGQASAILAAAPKRTRSAAKKHSKAKRHSAIEKTRRARREVKARK